MVETKQAQEPQGDSRPPPSWLNKELFQQALRNAGDSNSQVETIDVSVPVAAGDNYGSSIYRAKATLSDGQERSFIIKGPAAGAALSSATTMHMPNDASYDRLPLQLHPFDQMPPEQLKAPRGEKRRRGRSPCEPLGGGRGGGGGGERSAAEHGRAACAALFKLSADVISVIAQTAAARLSGFTADDARAGAGARDDAGHDDDDDDDANAHDTPRKKKKKGGPDSSMDLLGDTQEVVGATGSALSEIAVAATRGAARVLEVSCEAADSVGGGGGARGGATKEAIFRTFKEAAMDIVRAARAFGEALGGASEEAVLGDDPERPDSALSRDNADNDDNDADAQAPDKDCAAGVGGGGGAAPAPDGDGSRGAEDDALDVLDLCDDDDDLDEDGDATRGLLIGCDPPDDPSCIDAAPSPDMEDFLRNLLQDVRELTQRVGNRIN